MKGKKVNTKIIYNYLIIAVAIYLVAELSCTHVFDYQFQRVDHVERISQGTADYARHEQDDAFYDTKTVFA